MNDFTQINIVFSLIIPHISFSNNNHLEDDLSFTLLSMWKRTYIFYINLFIKRSHINKSWRPDLFQIYTDFFLNINTENGVECSKENLIQKYLDFYLIVFCCCSSVVGCTYKLSTQYITSFALRIFSVKIKWSLCIQCCKTTEGDQTLPDILTPSWKHIYILCIARVLYTTHSFVLFINKT